MVVASFKDLCLDANDAALVGRFWQRVLGGELVDLDDGDFRLDPAPGRPPNELIWVNAVPEPRTVKTRVHLDLRLAEPTPDPFLAAGAQVVREPGKDAWWVLTDPEGNEFCAFPPSPERSSVTGVSHLVVDCHDAPAQANWWAAILGGTADHDDRDAWIVDAAGFPWESWIFVPVPEPKTVKNRMHWDVELTEPEPAALVAAGAVVLREPDEDINWWVLTDPEGNEFCAFAPPSDTTQ